jgi:hypothetical protein
VVIVEIQEMERALEEFKGAVERGETVGDISRGLIEEQVLLSVGEARLRRLIYLSNSDYPGVRD